jgi:transcriptional regulator with XRE-family HTH domain
MQTYKEALAEHLKGYARQEEFAAKINKPQGTVSRYATGARFPDAEMAREIEKASDGAVPFSLWQAEALAKIGLAA